MKNIGKYISQKKKINIHSTVQKNAYVVDDQTITHLFSRAIREEYGRQGEKNIVPKFIKNGVIFVEITNSIWAQEMWMRRSYFIEQLNVKIGRKIVKNIKIAT